MIYLQCCATCLHLHLSHASPIYHVQATQTAAVWCDLAGRACAVKPSTMPGWPQHTVPRSSIASHPHRRTTGGIQYALHACLPLQLIVAGNLTSCLNTVALIGLCARAEVHKRAACACRCVYQRLQLVCCATASGSHRRWPQRALQSVPFATIDASCSDDSTPPGNPWLVQRRT